MRTVRPQRNKLEWNKRHEKIKIIQNEFNGKMAGGRMKSESAEFMKLQIEIEITKWKVSKTGKIIKL